jgi:2-polyprenyl-3-methyl-5-hydroxy-6-metoxy-1,4-benzoquinol methylase
VWNERYAEPGWAYGTEPNDFLVASVSLIPPGPVLDLCAGQGRNAVWLAQRGFDVTAVDGSSVGLSQAAALATERGVALTTEVIDLSELSIEPDRYTGIVSIFAHLPAELRRRIHREVVAGLRPGGVFVLEAYTPAQIALGTGGPKDPSMCMTLRGLEGELCVKHGLL